MFSLRTSFCCLLILTASQLPAADPPPAKDKDKDKAPPAERLVTTGRAVGTIGNWNDSDSKLKIHIKLRYIEPNQQAQVAYLRELQTLLVRQQTILRNPNPIQRQQELIRLIQDAQNLQGKPQNFYQIKEQDLDVEVELTDEIKIRVAAPPPLFDDKGNIKAYTAADLKELKKGTETIPGYPADRDSLRNGQTILVSVGYKVGGKPAEAEDGGDKKKIPPVAIKTKVLMVVILAEPRS